MNYLLLHAALALAAPQAELRATLAIDDGEHVPQTGWTIGGGLRAPVVGVLSASAALDLGLSHSSPPKARVYMPLELTLAASSRDDEPLYLALGAAPLLTDHLRLQPLAGVGYHRAQSPLRVEWHILAKGAAPVAWALTIGLRPTRPAVEPVVEPPPEPVVEALAGPTPEPAKVVPPTVTGPEDPLVWVPHPTCTWTPLSQAGPLLTTLPVGTVISFQAPGYLPATATLADKEMAIAMVNAPAQGSIVLQAWPGDAVLMDDYAITLRSDNAAVFTAAEGAHRLIVDGGGRHLELPLAVASGYAVWARIPAPQPTRVLFSASSSVLQPAGAKRIRELAAHAGTARFSVAGSYSPEGQPDANRVLANARAQVVVNALIADGVPEGQIVVGAPFEPDPRESNDEQRRVDVRPITEVTR